MRPYTLDYMRQSIASIPLVPFAGFRVVVSHDLPRPVIGTRVEARHDRTWLGRLCLRLFGLDTFLLWVSRGPIYGLPDIYRMGDTIVCCPEHVEALRRETASPIAGQIVNLNAN